MGENFGKFGKMNAISQYFTQPNSAFTEVTNVSYSCKFANIFLTKTLKLSIHRSLTPPKFCAIQYVQYVHALILENRLNRHIWYPLKNIETTVVLLC